MCVPVADEFEAIAARMAEIEREREAAIAGQAEKPLPQGDTYNPETNTWGWGIVRTNWDPPEC